MKVFVLLALVFASVLSMNMMTIEESPIDSNNDGLQKIPNNLQLSNRTGSGITSDMVSVFIKNINDAYTFYRDNITQNAKYIQNKLQGTYSSIFQVLILEENCTADYAVYASSSGGAYVAWTKVNSAKPLWSYIIISIGTTMLTKTSIHGGYQPGPAFTDTYDKVLENIIASRQTGKACVCNVSGVQLELEKFDGKRWNVVCAGPKNAVGGGFSGVIYQKQGFYEQTTLSAPARCRHLVWVI